MHVLERGAYHTLTFAHNKSGIAHQAKSHSMSGRVGLPTRLRAVYLQVAVCQRCCSGGITAQAVGAWVTHQCHACVHACLRLLCACRFCSAHADARHWTVVVCWSGRTRLPLATTLTTSLKQSCSTSFVATYQGTITLRGAAGSTAGASCTSFACRALLLTVCAHHFCPRSVVSHSGRRASANNLMQTANLVLTVSIHALGWPGLACAGSAQQRH
jgi:hypothetical protein